jgi:hypothetical protein
LKILDGLLNAEFPFLSVDIQRRQTPSGIDKRVEGLAFLYPILDRLLDAEFPFLSVAIQRRQTPSGID